MANKLFAEVVIAGSYKNLAKSTRGAEKELKSFEKAAKKISTAISTAFAGVAVIGIGMLWEALVDMTTAAQDDAKSMALLNKQMDNSWKASKKTKDEMNKYLETVSHMSGILDDDLRPAFGKIVKVTKDSTKAMDAFDMVMDISADSQKDVNTVASAYAKYLTGNKTALYRLIPGLREAGNEAEFLAEQMDGVAEVAGQNNPIGRITAIMEDFKEKIGTAFLPLLNQFSDWLSSDEAQDQLDRLAQSVQDVFKWFGSEEGKKGMKKFGEDMLKVTDTVIELAGKLEYLFKWIENHPLSKLAGLSMGGGDDKSKGKDNGFNIGNFVPHVAAWNAITGGGNKPSTIPNSANSPAGSSAMPNMTLQVNVNGMTGEQQIKMLKSTAKVRGIPLSKLLG